MANKKQLDNSSEKPYTTQEVAKIFGVTARTVQMWADSGIIHASKTPGGHRRISAEEVERLSNRINSKSPKHDTTSDSLTSEVNNTNRKPTILIVEDDADLRMLYRLEMENWTPSFDLEIVTDGYEALLVAGAKIPDVIVTDLHMPNFDGFHLIDVLSSNKSLEKSQIVVVTGLPRDEINKRYPFPETVIVLDKPIPFKRLKKIIFDQAKKINTGVI